MVSGPRERMKMRRFYRPLVLSFSAMFGALLLAGCGEKAIGIDPTNNAFVNVERLFDHDGCTVYRFHDYGHPRYYVRCRDQPARTEWTETYQCWKAQCSRAKSVPGA